MALTNNVETFTFQKLLRMKKGIPDLQLIEYGMRKIRKRKPESTEMSTYKKKHLKSFNLCIHYLVRFPFDRITSAVRWL